MNKVVEEAIKNMIRRIEELEEKLSRIPIPGKDGRYPLVIEKQNKFGLASEGQIKYIRILKGETFEGMTKQEAGIEIDKCLKEKKVTESHQQSPKVTEPKEVDTDDAGLEGDLL